MGYKPGDLFVGVIDFFGVLVPGAVLLSLILFQHSSVLVALGLHSWNMQNATPSVWVAFILASYVLGHFLTGISVPLNRLLNWYMPAAEDVFYNEVKASIPLPQEIRVEQKGWKKDLSVFRRAFFTAYNPEFRTPAFYRACAAIRVKEKTLALAEIERQMAEYKLFRSLSVVFCLDLLLWLIGGDHPAAGRIVLSLVLLFLALWRFVSLLAWTYRITFEYYAVLQSEDRENANRATAGQNAAK